MKNLKLIMMTLMMILCFMSFGQYKFSEKNFEYQKGRLETISLTKDLYKNLDSKQLLNMSSTGDTLFVSLKIILYNTTMHFDEINYTDNSEIYIDKSYVFNQNNYTEIIIINIYSTTEEYWYHKNIAETGEKSGK